MLKGPAMNTPRMRDIKKINWIQRFIGGAPILLVLVGLTSYLVFIKIPDVREQTKLNTINELKNIEKEKQVEVLTLSDNVNQGELVRNIVSKRAMSLDEIPDNAIKSIQDLNNKVIRFDAQKKTILTPDMLVDKDEKVTNDMRRQEYSQIKLPRDIQKGDIVDIRYKDNQRDKVVISHKRVEDIEGGLAINISEIERQFINAADIESRINSGELYVTVYLDPENQEPAAITYSPKKEIIEAMRRDPNINEKSLETIVEVLNEIKIEIKPNDSENFEKKNKVDS
ncbi:hypothetical protein [Sporosalibacterium faouarense]|uniref:hypothetical protein n=1 Tax=Sporosalibacterium faouarense TaxID=516123 RepID=UPI00192AEB3A|nr:hypothetical protein [Sporosalibacterium faouarense]